MRPAGSLSCSRSTHRALGLLAPAEAAACAAALTARVLCTVALLGGAPVQRAAGWCDSPPAPLWR